MEVYENESPTCLKESLVILLFVEAIIVNSLYFYRINLAEMGRYTLIYLSVSPRFKVY